MTSKLKTDVLETVSGSGTIALTNQLSGMTSASLPTLTHAEMPAGSVVQMVHTNYGTTLNTSSTAFVDIGYQLSITPLYANSKMFITFSTHIYLQNSSAAWNAVACRILRDSTAVDGGDPANSYGFGKYLGAGQYLYVTYAKTYIDSPNTTNAVIYKPQVTAGQGNPIEVNNSSAGGPSQLTIIEIKQ